MILIRGIKGESYARKIEEGVVDCRDVLSTILQPPVTGYEYSDYYEKNFVKALAYCTGRDVPDLHDPSFLYSLLRDYYIPHIYLTYFHVLSERSVEWLDSFDDDYNFIAVNVKLDRITGTAIGREFFGTRMAYVDSIRALNQNGYNEFCAACMCSIEHLFPNKLDMNIPAQIYNTLSFPLLCREQDDKFTDIENEFRIIAYDCPRIINGIRNQIPRKVTLCGKTGIMYQGMLEAGTDPTLISNLCVLRNPVKRLSDILIEEQGMVTIDSRFKPIEISNISDDYRYLGGKIECKKYIEKMLRRKPKDIYVNRVIQRTYSRSEISNAIFAPSHRNVKY